jgi:hypothetical protein
LAQQRKDAAAKEELKREAASKASRSVLLISWLVSNAAVFYVTMREVPPSW